MEYFLKIKDKSYVNLNYINKAKIKQKISFMSLK